MEGIWTEDKLTQNEHDFHDDKRRNLINMHLGRDRELVKQIQEKNIDIDVELLPSFR
jgi:hypothetical protein